MAHTPVDKSIRNLKQRAYREKKRTARTEAEKCVDEANRQASVILQRAQERVDEMLKDASLQAAGIVRQSELEASLIAEKTRILAERERVLLEREALMPRSGALDMSRLAVERRRRDAARKRASYARRKEAVSSTFRAEGDLDQIPNKSSRRVYSASQGLVSTFETETASFNQSARKLVLSRFWLHHSLKHLQPAPLGQPKLYASLTAGIADMRRTIQKVKPAKKTSHLVMKRNLLIALSGDSVTTGRHRSGLATILGIDRRNFDLSCDSRRRWDSESVNLECLWVRKTRCDKISEEVQKIVAEFWETRTKVSPNQKDVARLRLGPKEYEKHRFHWLEETQVEFFIRFQEWTIEADNPYRGKVDLNIGLRAFEKMKPYYVRVLKDRNVCCCKQHVEMDLLREAFNKLRQCIHSKQPCVCSCKVCRPFGETSCLLYRDPVTSVRSWCEQIVCPKQEGAKWHNLDCIMGQCNLCGIKKLSLCAIELESDSTRDVVWSTFEYQHLDKNGKVVTKEAVRRAEGTSKDEAKSSKRLRMVEKETPLSVFIKHLQKTIPLFVQHNFRARWQCDEYRKCLGGFPRGSIVSTIDFAENYTFKVQNEVQSLHWDNRQITILVHITYRHRDDQSLGVLEKADGKRHIVADYHFYISDDNNHDSLFVQHCLDLHWRWMKDAGISVNFHYVWSDGCAAQFKSRQPFFFVSRYAKTYGAYMMWNFYGSGHGKGVQDGLGGQVKTALAKEQLKPTGGHKMDDAADAVEFLRKRFALGKEMAYGEIQEVRRHFHLIGKTEVNRKKKWDCSPIEGCRKLHSFFGFSDQVPTHLQVREFSCFCVQCLDHDYDQCLQKAHVAPWRLEIVHPKLPSDVLPFLADLGVGESMGDLAETWGGGSLCDLLQVGDYYAIEADYPNEWNAEFYVLHCLKPLHMVENCFEDAYGQSFQKGDMVVEGRWYQPWGTTSSLGSYVLEPTSEPSFCLGSSVIHIRFPLKPTRMYGTAPGFSLSADTISAIRASLE